MALTVENGTGLVDAESYQSVADFKVYCDARGMSYAGKSDTLIEQALRRGTEWLDATYRGSYCGLPLNPPDQALEWPRVGMVDRNGYAIPSDSVPRQVKAATAEASHRELITPGYLLPDYVGSERIKRSRKKVGPLEKEIEYQGGSGTAADVQPIIAVIAGIMASLLSHQTSALSGRTVRY